MLSLETLLFHVQHVQPAGHNKQDADSALTSGRCIGHRLVYMQISCKSR